MLSWCRTAVILEKDLGIGTTTKSKLWHNWWITGLVGQAVDAWAVLAPMPDHRHKYHELEYHLHIEPEKRTKHGAVVLG